MPRQTPNKKDMKTIDELIYYCNEPEPIGALMLTGEWGSGKTFLIEHQLKEELKNTHILVRVSLFGVESVEAVNKAVRSQWISNCTSFFGKIQDKTKTVNTVKTALGGVATFIPYLRDVKDAVLSIDPLDYVAIKPIVGEGTDQKKVVLIFDDLERSKLDTTDVLGAINEYCENLHFNTIIVANEDKINRKDSENKNLSYDEIKEKIVERTICLDPDYDAIVDSIVDNRTWFNDEYTSFLRENRDLVKDIFSTEIDSKQESTNSTYRRDKEKKKIKRPRNIRSLKCALQDFYRVYSALKAAELPDVEKYLYSFLAYTMAEKAGIAKRGDYGFLFTDEYVKNAFPLFNNQMLFASVRNWIHDGIWNEDLLKQEIAWAQERNKELEPKDKLRRNRIIDLDEDVIRAGFDGLLDYAYNGELSLDEYIYFIGNSALLRDCNFVGLKPIDWEKVRQGIHKSIEAEISAGENNGHMHQYIDDESRANYSEDELKAYDIIKQYRKNNVGIFERNRRLYLDSIKKSGSYAFTQCKNKRFNSFDIEMAEATAKAFDETDQYEREGFPSEFKSLWQFVDQSKDFDLEKTKAGFEKLSELLGTIKAKYESEQKNIAAYHAKNFIKTVKELIEKIDIVEDSKNSNSIETQGSNSSEVGHND